MPPGKRSIALRSVTHHPWNCGGSLHWLGRAQRRASRSNSSSQSTTTLASDDRHGAIAMHTRTACRSWRIVSMTVLEPTQKVRAGMAVSALNGLPQRRPEVPIGQPRAFYPDDPGGRSARRHSDDGCGPRARRSAPRCCRAGNVLAPCWPIPVWRVAIDPEDIKGAPAELC